MENLYIWQYEDDKNRGPYWYVIALSIIVGIVIWGFITGQYGMSVIILFVSGLFYYIENNSEDNIIVSITDKGVQIGPNFYEFTKIEKYTYIFDGDNPFFLRLVVNKVSIKNIDLRIDEYIIEELKKVLPDYMQEDAKGELSFIEKLIHKLKL